MTVDLALFRGDECLGRGTIRINKAEESSEIPVNNAITLLVKHKFALPACSIGMELWRCVEGSNETKQLLEAGIAMGVHESDDWESVALGPEYTLGFLCRPEI